MKTLALILAAMIAALTAQAGKQGIEDGQLRNNLDAAGYRITGAASGTGTTDYVTLQQLVPAYVAKTALYTITATDYTVDCTSGTFAITLPTAVGTSGYGKVYVIKNSGTGVITIATTSAQTIDGQASSAITLNRYDSITVQSNNANWIIL